MKEKTVILAVLLIAAMFTMLFVSAVKAWEYSNTTINNPQTDNLWDPTGPRADKVLIAQYSDESQEFAALQAGLIDMTDWPITTNEYPTWTTGPLDQSIAVVNTGAEFGLYLLDLRCNNDTYIQTTGPNIANPAFNPSYGNPMADVWLRRAIACVNDRPHFANDICSGTTLPRLATPLYTDLSPAYGAWADPSLAPGLTPYAYCTPGGGPDVVAGNAYLDAHGYVYNVPGDCRLSQGGTYKFSIEFIVRSDDWHRLNSATFPGGVVDLMTKAPPFGLGLKNNLIVTQKVSGGAKADFMGTKKAHMYTGGWGLTEDPDHLYYLFSKVGYWHPGNSTNYAGYPGDLHDEYLVNFTDTAGSTWNYTGFPGNYSWIGSGFNFADTVDDPVGFGDPGGYWTHPTYANLTDLPGGQNPANYWSRQMMVATTQSRAQYCANKTQEFLAYWACGVPWWAAASYTAFSRKYVGGTPQEAAYVGHYWEGVVNQKGLGVWSTVSLLDMHTDNAEFGDGSHMVIRQGFRQPTLSLNPCYAEWASDWNVLNLEYASMIGPDPYTLSNWQGLASSWSISTWINSGGKTCTKISFFMRSDLCWSDSVPITPSDVVFTWGGPKVIGSISNYVASRGLPPPYWSANLLDIVSVTSSGSVVTVFLDTYSYFGLHSMSGFNIVLPQHIWQTPFQTGTPTWLWGGPNVVSGPWILENNWDPSLHGSTLVLDKRVNNNMQFPPSSGFHVTQQASPQVTAPIVTWSDQASNASAEIGDIHWIYPNKNQFAVQLSDTVTIHNYYVYRTGPNMSQAYPYTTLDGLRTVELYRWNRTGSPNGGTYNLIQTLETNVSVDLPRGQDVVETFSNLTLTSGYYYFEVSFNITSLAYSTDGITYTPVPDDLNVFWNLTSTYREYAIVTSRYDILGAFWTQPGNYQPIPDLKVNVVDTFTAALAYGSQPGFANWNPVADVNDDNRVNLLDTFAINLAYGSVF